MMNLRNRFYVFDRRVVPRIKNFLKKKVKNNVKCEFKIICIWGREHSRSCSNEATFGEELQKMCSGFWGHRLSGSILTFFLMGLELQSTSLLDVKTVKNNNYGGMF